MKPVCDLEAAETLPRLRIPLANGAEPRKLFFDRADLDRLISVWRDHQRLQDAQER